MGVMKRLGRRTPPPPRKSSDEVLLLQGMMMMIEADGEIQDEELATLSSFCETLPDFHGKDLRDLMRQARLNLRRMKKAEQVRSLGQISNDAVKKKLFVLAMDLAMSGGDVDESEDRLLDAMMRVLDIDDDLARTAMYILDIKYSY